MQEAIHTRVQEKSTSSYLARHWRGDLSLPKSFWINGILILGILIFASWYVLLPLSLLLEKAIPLFKGNDFIWFFGDIATYIIIYVWAVVGVGRSAKKYEGSVILGILARVAILFGIVPVVGVLVLLLLSPRGC